MRKNILTLVAVTFMLVGCSTTPVMNKSFIVDDNINNQLAIETATQIKNTKVNDLKIEVNDNFGLALYQNLKNQKLNIERIDSSPLSGQKENNKENLVVPNLIYFADTVSLMDDNSKDNELYRVVYKYNQVSYSKMFSLSNNKLLPLSNWSVRKGK